MTAIAPTTHHSNETHASVAGFWTDLRSVALRAVRLALREPEAIIPAIAIPVFFFVVNVGSLQKFVQGNGSSSVVFDYKAFQLPVSIVFAVTGVSRAASLVADIQNGYFDRLLLTPIRRLTILLGLMVADFAVVLALTIPVVILGLAVGVRFATGVPGALLFILLGGLWGLVFTGFPYAIALKTGNAAAVNSSFLLFFPFAFLTTAYLPKAALTGWLSNVATYNPMTYLLDGLRSLVMRGWELKPLLGAVAANAGLGVVRIPLALSTLRGRLRGG
jgi:ABC-2 type transport system permease protein